MIESAYTGWCKKGIVSRMGLNTTHHSEQLLFYDLLLRMTSCMTPFRLTISFLQHLVYNFFSYNLYNKCENKKRINVKSC